MWQSLVSGIQAILGVFYDVTVSIGIPSYGLSIILFTIILKLLLYPLTYKQMHSMKRMQEIQPKIKEVQDKYRKNPEKANQMIMEIYKENKVNPMAGCLPLLVQMPILIALFQALRGFSYQDAGSSFLWVPHLQNPDPYYIIPILVALSTYYQSKVSMPDSSSNPAAASSNKMMLYFMPLMIGYFSLSMPAGLGLYWIIFGVLGIVQQLYINKKPSLKKEGSN